MEGPVEEYESWSFRVDQQPDKVQRMLLPLDMRFSGRQWAGFFNCDTLKVQAASGKFTQLPADLPFSVRMLQRVTACDGSEDHPIVWDGEGELVLVVV
jgi:hypothetical protein